jgi:hypothetical protein
MIKHVKTTMNFTNEDIKCLSILADESEMTNTAYVRYLIHMMWAVRNELEILKTGKITFEGHTYQIDLDQIGHIGQEMAQILNQIDWEGIIQKSKKAPLKRLKKPNKSIFARAV